MFNVMSLTCEFNGHGSWPFTARFIPPARRVLAGIGGYLRAGVAADGVGVFAGPAALGDAGSSGLRVLAGGLRCA